MQCAQLASVSLRGTRDIPHLPSPVMEAETVVVISSLVLPPGKQKCLRVSAGQGESLEGISLPHVTWLR